MSEPPGEHPLPYLTEDAQAWALEVLAEAWPPEPPSPTLTGLLDHLRQGTPTRGTPRKPRAN
jgi:hypothetical protein